MKLSFSVRGWWQEGWDELVSTATEMRFQGIEIYNVLRQSELVGKGGPFHKYNCAATVRQLRDRGLSIPCFDTSLDISENDENGALVAEVMAYAAIKTMHNPEAIAAALLVTVIGKTLIRLASRLQNK